MYCIKMMVTWLIILDIWFKENFMGAFAPMPRQDGCVDRKYAYCQHVEDLSLLRHIRCFINICKLKQDFTSCLYYSKVQPD